VIQIIGWICDALDITNIFGRHISFGWIGLGGSIVFAIFMTLMVQEYHNKLKLIENAKPNMVLKKIDENLLGDVSTRKYSESLNAVIIEKPEHPYFTRIWIANEPSTTLLSADAVKMYGEIEFWDELAQRQYFTMGGRWAETKEITNGGQPIDIDQIDIPPNGRPYCLDIGLKYQDEEEFYGYNNETPRKKTNGFRDKDRQLCKGVYIVRARFRCKGLDTSFCFRLENLGKGEKVRFIPIQPHSNIGERDSQI
jgi:hypothetical protein